MLYYLRQVPFFQKTVTVIIQSIPGPCPILAIANVLSLRGQINFHPDQQSIQFEEIVQILNLHLQRRLDNLTNANDISEDAVANFFKNFEETSSCLGRLEGGLDVNVIFADVARFEFTPEVGVFDSFSIRLVHGWVIDPADRETARVLGQLSYNQLTHMIMSDDDMKSGSKSPTSVNDELAARENDRIIARNFLAETAGQMTYLGLERLHSYLAEHELTVVFHANHFAVLLKRNGRLYELITDIRLVDDEPLLVWTELSAIDNDVTFLDAFFVRPSLAATASARAFNNRRLQQARAAALSEADFYHAFVYDPTHCASTAQPAFGGGGGGSSSSSSSSGNYTAGFGASPASAGHAALSYGVGSVYGPNGSSGGNIDAGGGNQPVGAVYQELLAQAKQEAEARQRIAAGYAAHQQPPLQQQPPPPPGPRPTLKKDDQSCALM